MGLDGADERGLAGALDWRMLMPPKLAMETAMKALVTVTIGEGMMGRKREMLRVRQVERSTP